MGEKVEAQRPESSESTQGSKRGIVFVCLICRAVWYMELVLKYNEPMTVYCPMCGEKFETFAQEGGAAEA